MPIIRIFCLFLLASAGMLAQSSDSQTLQALLQELRQLRQEMRGMTLVSQRVQLLLHRVQLQDDATKKAKERHDQINAQLKEVERNRNEAINNLRGVEEKLNSAQNPNQRGEFEDFVREMKRNLERLSQEESGYRTAEVTVANELRTEQAKLAELQQRLDRMEQQLENYASGPVAK